MDELEIDVAQTVKLATYGPFTIIVLYGGTTRCEFCGRMPEKVAELHSNKVDQIVNACFYCEALKFLIGAESTAKLLFETTVKATDKTSSDLEKIGQETLDKLRDDRNHQFTVMKFAKEYYERGIGKGWKIMPSLLQQYQRRKSLSQRQWDIVYRFIASCKSEAKKKGV